MFLSRLSLRNFRLYEGLDLEVPDGALLFEGPNASGKTTILEAVYYLATLRSFRTRRVRNLVRWDADEAFLGAKIEGPFSRVLRIVLRDSGRSVSIDGRAVSSFSDYYGTFQCVVFSPEDRVLVSGGNSGRRVYVDMLLSVLEPGYLAAIQEYTRALRSRNALLRDAEVSGSEIRAFEEILADRAWRIVASRRDLFRRLGSVARAHYAAISSGNEEMRLEYRPSVELDPGAANDFLGALRSVRPRDLQLGMTTVGPHRDEIRIRIDGRTAAEFASQGQSRTIALTLRLAEADMIRERFGDPILLVDDVLGQLDERRRHAFLERMGGSGQVWITCAGGEIAGPRPFAARFRVEGGRVRAPQAD